jgi:YidC/Oxa1 family membrane protein insertase
MTRNLIIGWALLMALFLGWTQYKGHQTRELQKERAAQMAADSAAAAAKAKLNPASAGNVAATDATRGAKAAGSAALAPAKDAAIANRAQGIPDAEPRAITVRATGFTAVLDARGARVAELRVPAVGGHVPYNPVLIRPEGEGALTLSLNGIPLDSVVWSTSTEETYLNADSAAVTVTFSTVLPGNIPVSRSYSFAPGQAYIRHSFTAPEGAIRGYALDWKGGLEETDRIMKGQGFGLTANFFSEVVFDNGTNAQREAFKGEKTFNAESGVLRWVGLRRKYVAVVMDFGTSVQDRLDARLIDPNAPETSGRGQHESLSSYALRLAGGGDEKAALNFDFRVMPLQYDGLKALNRNYEQILFTGWEWFLRADVWYVKLCGLVLRLLNLFHSWIPNYGIAIILLTLLVRFITLPLSVNQTRQAAKMAVHQPEIRKIQEKFKGDRQKSQTAIMDYYRQQGINPMAPVLGCFPLLLQMPVFISLFNVLGRAVELHEAPFFGWIHDLSRPDVVYAGLKIPYLFPAGLTVLPFLMAGTMWVQMRMTIKDPNQKAMIWLMPVVMFVFSGSFPSGLVLYWSISNLFTIGQTKVFGTVSTAKVPSVTISPAPSKNKPGKKK